MLMKKGELGMLKEKYNLKKSVSLKLWSNIEAQFAMIRQTESDSHMNDCFFTCERFRKRLVCSQPVQERRSL